MQNDEKDRRCRYAKTRYVVLTDVVQCKVYTRWMGDCDDCSFYNGRVDL